jgi:hypothetical protein
MNPATFLEFSHPNKQAFYDEPISNEVHVSLIESLISHNVKYNLGFLAVELFLSGKWQPNITFSAYLNEKYNMELCLICSCCQAGILSIHSTHPQKPHIFISILEF